MAFKIKDGIRIGTVDVFNVQAQLMATTAINAISMTDATDSTSVSTGALKIAGGVGIAKNLFVGDAVNTNKIDPILVEGAGKIQFGIPNTAGSYLEIDGATDAQYATLIANATNAIPNKKYVDDAVTGAASATALTVSAGEFTDDETPVLITQTVNLATDTLNIVGGDDVTVSVAKSGNDVTFTVNVDFDLDQNVGSGDAVTFASVTVDDTLIDNNTIAVTGAENDLSLTTADGDINLTATGGTVIASDLTVSSLTANRGVFTGTAGALLTNDGFTATPDGNTVAIVVTGSLTVDELNLNGDTISATGAATDIDVILTPKGTGTVDVSGAKITSLATPTVATDAANKEYVDEVAQGLKTRTAANVYVDSNLVATYDNGTAGVGATLTANANGAFPEFDGVTANTTTLRRVLVAGQTNAAHNGLYVLIDAGDASNPWILRRCVECDTAEKIPGSYVFVNGGTIYKNTGWVASVADAGTFVVGTDAISWVQFSGAGSFSAGDGLTLTGTVFSVNVDDSTIEIASDILRVKDAGITNAKLANSTITIAADTGTADPVSLGQTVTFVGGTGLSTAVTDNTITINGDDATTTTKGIASFSADDFAVTNGAVTIKADGVTLGTQTTGDYVATVTATSNTGISVTGTGEGAAVTIAGIDATTTVKGVASFSDDDFAVTSGAVTIKTGGVSNTQLVNDSVTVGTTAIALGGTSTTLAGLTQLDVDNIRIDGNTISSTDTNGPVIINPDANGKVELNFADNADAFAQITGATATQYKANITGAGKANAIPNRQYVDDAVSGATSAISTLTVGDGTGTQTVSLGTDTLRVVATADLGLTSVVTKSGTNTDLTLTLAQDIRTTASPTFDNTTLTGDLAVNGGDITTTATTFNLVNTTATTVNFAGAATAVSIGANTGTTTVNNNLTVTGDLVVNGTTTSVNTITLEVEDPLIKLAKGNPADSVSIGFYGQYGATPAKSGFFRSHTNGEWYLFTGLTGDITTGNVISTSGLTLADINLGNVKTGVWDASTIAVNRGGTGQTSYTDGQLLIGNSTGNTLTKATLTAGSGIGITNGSGAITIDSTDTLATVTARGATTSDAVTITNATAATTTTTGALQVTGGIATANNVHVGGEIRDDFVHSSSKTQAVSATSLTVVDTFALDTYRSGRYIIQITQGTAYQMSEFRIIHNGTNTFITEYAVLETNGELGDFTAAINGSNVEISVTMGAADAATVKLNRTLITV
jgi:hypothetical protein